MAVIRYEISPEGRAVVQRHQQRGKMLIKNLDSALQRGLDTFKNELQVNMLTGGDWRTKRNGQTPLALRSGMLRNSIMTRNDGNLSGVFGAGKGAASKYAAVQLGNETHVITPKNAKYLAIPIADGLTGSGQPTALTINGPRDVEGLKIFKAKTGNLVGFLPESGYQFSDTGAAKFGTKRYKKGPRKGKQKGLLLFVFKKSVTVQGSDALAKAVNSKRVVFRNLIQAAVSTAIEGEATGG